MAFRINPITGMLDLVGGGVSGTVTSVGLADTSTTPIFTVSGSPVTTSGTIDLTLNAQSANTVLAGPTSGGSAQPTFRSLVSADIPSLSGTYVTQSEVGTANGVASLDGGGKVPLSQLPSSVFIYQGTWDPTTNTPTLIDGTGTTGYVYWVSAAYTGPVVGLSNPSMVDFQVGDLVIYNGTQWELTTPAAGVQSVNGATGAVTVNAINQLTGDATAGPASGSASAALTLATVNSNTGSFGSSTAIPSFTVNGKGLITAASTNAVVAPAGTLSGTTLNSTVVSSSLTSVGTITSGTWTGTTIAVANGGTGQVTAPAAFNALSPITTTGDMIYSPSGATSQRLPIGSSGNVLTVSGGVPSWQPLPTIPVPSSGDINETQFTAADNQASPANVTGLAFANATVRSADILLSVTRSSTYAQYKISLVQGASSWYMSDSYVGDATGLTFSVTTGGQVQYVSTSTGSTANIHFRALVTSVSP